MVNFLGKAGLTKLITLVLTLLETKQDLMEEITAEEVNTMWAAIAV